MTVDYLGALKRDAPALLAAAEAAGLDADVPPCPDWGVRDLLAHMVGVYGSRALVVRERLMQRPSLIYPDLTFEPPADADVVALYQQVSAELIQLLEDADPTTPVWTWFPPDQTIGFWHRRMAQETVIHRADAESATGAITAVAPDLAVDGIDELFDCFLDDLADELEEDLGAGGETVHLHAHDAAGEWFVKLHPRSLEVTREHAKGDVAVRGGASALLLWLWGRGPLEDLEVIGARGAAEQLREYARAGTQ